MVKCNNIYGENQLLILGAYASANTNNILKCKKFQKISRVYLNILSVNAKFHGKPIYLMFTHNTKILFFREKTMRAHRTLRYTGHFFVRNS
jgi:hypothetical protein